VPELIGPLWKRAESAPDAPALTFTQETGERIAITAGSLRRSAEQAAAAMAGAGVRPGDIVLIAVGHSRALIDAFLGAVAVGAAPAIAPYFTGRLDPVLYAQRVDRMVTASNASLLVVSPDLAARLPDLSRYAHCRIMSANGLTESGGGAQHTPPSVADDALAYVQFSSGSTGAQKAVAHTQRGMRDYLIAKADRDAFEDDDSIVSWLPLYHDMGLVSGLLTPLRSGVHAVLMSPAHWVRDPKILLHAFNDFRGTVTWMPNFALSHCARVVRDRDIEGIDLSSWRRVILGAEVVRYESMREFAERFGPYGFRASALQAGYGMAEVVEGATSTPRNESAHVDWVSRSELQSSRRAVPASPESADATSLVSCGVPLLGTELKIVDDGGRALPERSVGEVAVRSSYCMTGGYFGRGDLTAAVVRDGWLHTGDLGYLAGGELYVCGRKKDLIIVGGHNVMPDDLETIAGRVDGVAAGRVVAFGVFDSRLGTDRAVIVCELAKDLDAETRRAVEAQIRKRIVGELDVAVSEIRFVERGWIIKTSSGKLARSANREKYLGEKRDTERAAEPLVMGGAAQ
jgi:acyl-CoA synthetase (AMP-forming)/AMP-acid ligase II